MIMGTEVLEVSRYLKIKSIIIPCNNDWLTSCVECFKEQGSYSLNQLNELVYQQWLLADLCDIGVKVLPDSCLNVDKFILQGRYAVQLNYFVNIAVSCHKQLQKIRRPETLKNLEVDSEVAPCNKEVVSGNRILKIEITDGVLTVVGFEDHFIPSFHEPLVPGKKAILVGPLECRKGILFLRPSNIQILGGEVDSLHIPNATENILARTLKLPENPDPYHLEIKEESTQIDNVQVKSNNGLDDDEEAMLMLAEVIENEVSSDDIFSGMKPMNNVGKNCNKKNNTTHKINAEQSNVSQELFKDQEVHSQNRDSLNDDFDDDMVELEEKITFSKRIESIEFDNDFELLENQTSQGKKVHHNSKLSSLGNLSTNISECQVIDTTSSRKQYEQITELKRKLNESYATNEVRPSTSGNNNVFNEKFASTSFQREKIIVDYLSESESPLINLTGESEPCITDSHLSEVDLDNYFNSDPFPPQKRPALVKTHARVIKVLKKPKLKGDKWSVNAVVAARGIELEVIFASEVIDKIFTVSAAELLSRRAELISDPVLKQRTNETLKNSQLRFSTLACMMVFSFKDAISKPVIVNIE